MRYNTNKNTPTQLIATTGCTARIIPNNGLPSATIPFTVPTTPGTYELRFYANNLYTLLASLNWKPVN